MVDDTKRTAADRQLPLVIYHANCWDGFCAAWVARKALGGHTGAIEAVPAYYGQKPPNVAGRRVWVLDFSYPFDVMADMASASEHLIVLDHHQSAQRAIADLEAMFITHNMAGAARYSADKSGGRMAWEFFFPDSPSPWLVDYTEDRDLWRHALPESENINAALRSHPLDFDLWDEFHDAVGQREMFKREGAAIRRAERQIVEAHVRNARVLPFCLMTGGPSQWDDLHVPVVNATTLFSEIAGELAKGHPFAACYFDRQDGKRQWSLRSAPDGWDVSEIAKAYGGGGHKHAAGFEQTLSVATQEAEIARLRQECADLRGAMAADDERLRAAERRVWGGGLTYGCDGPEHLADEIERLRNLESLVREWQEARKPTTLAAPGEFLAEAFQSAVRRMSAADEALAAYRLDGASDDVYGPLQAIQPDGRRAPDAVALSGVPTDAGDARPAAALSLRDELAEIIRWRFCAAAGEIMDGVKMLKAAQEIADAIAPMIEEATGAR